MTTQILMPALSPTMEEGKLAKWHVKEGDAVKSGDVLAEIETDKATMEFEAVDEGKIGKILVAEGTEGVKVNAPIAILVAEGETAAAVATDITSAMDSIKAAVTAETKEVKQPEPVKTEAPKAAAPHPEEPASAGVSKDRIFASPLAKRIAQQNGIDLAALAGSGPRGRIVKSDVEKAEPGTAAVRHPEVAAQPPAKGAEAPSQLPDARLFYAVGDYDEIPHDAMRKAIAKRLTASTSNIPHFYLTIDCNIDALMAARAKLNASAPKGAATPAFKLSVNDFLVKAAALALKRVPEVNASWTDTAVLRHKHADVGVAVALDFGLITPIVFKAEDKGLVAISNEVKDLAEKARAKKLKPQDYEGGSFAISNLGMMGIKHFTAVINPPQAAILAVGAGEQKPVIVDGKVVAATIMTVTMSCDHRVIDGATGARFLQVFKQYVEEPAAMLL